MIMQWVMRVCNARTEEKELEQREKSFGCRFCALWFCLGVLLRILLVEYVCTLCLQSRFAAYTAFTRETAHTGGNTTQPRRKQRETIATKPNHAGSGSTAQSVLDGNGACHQSPAASPGWTFRTKIREVAPCRAVVLYGDMRNLQSTTKKNTYCACDSDVGSKKDCGCCCSTCTLNDRCLKSDMIIYDRLMMYLSYWHICTTANEQQEEANVTQGEKRTLSRRDSRSFGHNFWPRESCRTRLTRLRWCRHTWRYPTQQAAWQSPKKGEFLQIQRWKGETEFLFISTDAICARKWRTATNLCKFSSTLHAITNDEG